MLDVSFIDFSINCLNYLGILHIAYSEGVDSPLRQAGLIGSLLGKGCQGCPNVNRNVQFKVHLAAKSHGYATMLFGFLL